MDGVDSRVRSNRIILVGHEGDRRRFVAGLAGQAGSYKNESPLQSDQQMQSPISVGGTISASFRCSARCCAMTSARIATSTCSWSSSPGTSRGVRNHRHGGRVVAALRRPKVDIVSEKYLNWRLRDRILARPRCNMQKDDWYTSATCSTWLGESSSKSPGSRESDFDADENLRIAVTHLDPDHR